MKAVALVFLSIFMALSCQCKKQIVTPLTIVEETNNEVAPKMTLLQENKQTNNMVQYEALSRGYFKKITFQNNTLTISSDRNNADKGEVVKLSSEDAQEINKLLKAIDPEVLPSLKGPTEMRFYDGAAHANLIITSNGITHTGAGFDHGHPPAAIEKLVKKLISFSEKE